MSPPSSRRLDRLIGSMSVLGLMAMFVYAWQPVNSGMVRCAIILGGVTAVAGTTWIACRWRMGRWSASVVLAMAVASIVWPGRSVRREDYVAGLVAFVGTRYVWGGENLRGIDCSGLLRAGLRDACVRRGRTRDALRLWWNDASASTLGAGYDGQCRSITKATSIAGLDDATIAPGDIAVTSDGVHCLAYLGAGRWISADPDAGSVIVDEKGSANPYLETPVTILRWRMLDHDGSGR